ncbi:MAG: SDR family NAD(P)-dependent oxidoreductase [Anaerolineae bacterium]|nr:SDR family NAD(P)-dependent oxidoreductase [Anaerolineae bacterium]
MMKAFVTGGSGFIGQHVVRKLIERGYEVHALARSERSTAVVRDLGAIPVPGDITDTAAMRAGMAGRDLVLHLAAWYHIGSPDWMEAEAINVGGTRRVLHLAHELGVPKIVYVSSVAVFGDTKGELVDETFFQGGPFLTEYDRTKWLAHLQSGLPMIEEGAPIIIAMPGFVYGPGDTSQAAQMMRMFYRGYPLCRGQRRP